MVKKKNNLIHFFLRSSNISLKANISWKCKKINFSQNLWTSDSKSPGSVLIKTLKVLQDGTGVQCGELSLEKFNTHFISALSARGEPCASSFGNYSELLNVERSLKLVDFSFLSVDKNFTKILSFLAVR